MKGDNAPAWLCIDNGNRSAPKAIGSSTDSPNPKQKERMREYNHTHKKSHHTREAKP